MDTSLIAETVVVAVVKDAVEVAPARLEVTVLVIAEAAATSLMLVRPAMLATHDHSDYRIGDQTTVHSIQSRSTECGRQLGLKHWQSSLARIQVEKSRDDDQGNQVACDRLLHCTIFLSFLVQYADLYRFGKSLQLLLLPLSLRLVILLSLQLPLFFCSNLISASKREECDHLPVFCMKLGAPWPKLL